jgi:hypothetical protein
VCRNNKALILRAHEELLNKRNLKLIDELLATNYANHSGTEVRHGSSNVKQFCAVLRAAFPDLHVVGSVSSFWVAGLNID